MNSPVLSDHALGFWVEGFEEVVDAEALFHFSRKRFWRAHGLAGQGTSQNYEAGT